MAAEARAGARAYLEIKRAILAGELRQRQRLDIDQLATRWRVSATPVRHALAALTSERLVTAHASQGYHVAFWSETELSALYEWRWQLARLAAESLGDARPVLSVGDDFSGTIVAVLSALHVCSNAELKRAAVAADERLLAAYRVEPDVLPQSQRELALLLEALSGGEQRRLALRLRSFFRRRIAHCGAIRARAGVKALPRNGD